MCTYMRLGTSTLHLCSLLPLDVRKREHDFATTYLKTSSERALSPASINFKIMGLIWPILNYRKNITFKRTLSAVIYVSNAFSFISIIWPPQAGQVPPRGKDENCDLIQAESACLSVINERMESQEMIANYVLFSSKLNGHCYVAPRFIVTFRMLRMLGQIYFDTLGMSNECLTERI